MNNIEKGLKKIDFVGYDGKLQSNGHVRVKSAVGWIFTLTILYSLYIFIFSME